VDAVIIATPHWQHASIAIAALRAGKHVVCEKPLAVTVDQADAVLQAADEARGTFAVVYQTRFEPAFRHAKALLDSGELGPVYRCEIVETGWRPQAYYQSSPWRGTWKGEGGGVLLNQAPHVLDRYVWLCGMPESVVARCDTNLHDIEVEDTASAILRHASGAHGLIHVNTVETPPVSRTVVSCDRGSITIENGKTCVTRLRDSIRERTNVETQPIATIAAERFELSRVPTDPFNALLTAFYDDFAAAVFSEAPLSCPGTEGGTEGRGAVELANAIILSSMRGSAVTLPLVREEYTRLIASLTS
jgi:predicted dehydrogenase